MAAGLSSSPQQGSYAEENRLLQDELDRRERKRQQNRLAQQNYSSLYWNSGCNQKQRIKALEAAAASSRVSPEDPSSRILALSTIEAATVWSTTTVDNINVWGEAARNPPPENSGSSKITAVGSTNMSTGSATFYAAAASEEDGRTALHRAISVGSEPLVRLLLESGANMSRQDASGCTALHIAAEAGVPKAWRNSYPKRRPDPNQTDYLGRNALFSAVQGRSVAVVRLLLDDLSVDARSADPLGNVQLHVAVEQESEEMASLLLAYGADIDA
ncbi:ankyrin repeat-containing domain protein [Apodospora peruviana]|uniref:Ankyrin repeat-containing domain protein n=1 Tax=Apodospora peruviana TaxID=516989 RepID=A0AAE0HVH3_9PEZI|nr:ankyrin repeat-containing domain protein [Apodospora peruviana]